MDPQVSIVVPLSCGLVTAQRCLEAIGALHEPPSFEVIVVADAAPWLEPLLVLLEGDVTVLRNDRPLGPAATVARGLEAARAPLTAVLDGAALPAPDWLGQLAARLEDPATGTAFSPDCHGGGVMTARGAMWRTDEVRTADLDHPDAGAPIAELALALAQRALAVVAGPAGAVSPRAETAAAHPPRHPAELTVVIPTLDPSSERIRRCLTAVRHCTDAPHQIVIVDNGSPPQGFSDPVNAGLRAAATPYVVVMNDDVEVLPGWWEPLREAIDKGAAVVFPLTVDGAMRTDFAAWCFAAGRDALLSFGHGPDTFFDPSLVVWFQDTDLLVRLRAAGRPPQLVSASQIRHGLSQTLSSPEPRLSAWVQTQIAQDERAFRAKHPDTVLQGAAAR
jgi:GT2 family glycosyltransferase